MNIKSKENNNVFYMQIQISSNPMLSKLNKILGFYT